MPTKMGESEIYVGVFGTGVGRASVKQLERHCIVILRSSVGCTRITQRIETLLPQQLVDNAMR
jgi:hypothetical protein